MTDETRTLRSRIREVLATTPAKFANGEPVRPWPEHGTQHTYDATCALCRGDVDTLTDAVLSALGDEAVEHATDQLVADMRLRSMEIRGGTFDMDITEAREMAALYVGMARTMLGDAENYSETPIAFPKEHVDLTVKVAESPEEYVLIVQRAGKLTPHQARKRAEAERDAALARVADLEAAAAAKEA